MMWPIAMTRDPKAMKIIPRPIKLLLTDFSIRKPKMIATKRNGISKTANQVFMADLLRKANSYPFCGGGGWPVIFAVAPNGFSSAMEYFRGGPRAQHGLA